MEKEKIFKLSSKYISYFFTPHNSFNSLNELLISFQDLYEFSSLDSPCFISLLYIFSC